MKNNQLKYLKYASEFAENNKTHIWLGGSFLKGNATEFSDIDLSIFCDVDILNKFIYGYGNPVYISYTSNPQGIIIVIYKDGVALDLGVIENINTSEEEYFHKECIDFLSYVREENICQQFALSNDIPYQVSRLFHRSLIKFLSGKRTSGVNILNEITEFLNSDIFADEQNYIEKFTDILSCFNMQFPLPAAYYSLLNKLINKL